MVQCRCRPNGPPQLWWLVAGRRARVAHHDEGARRRAQGPCILAFANDLRGRSVRLWEDNQAVVHIIRIRTSRSPLLMAELCLLLEPLDDLDIRLAPRYIKSELKIDIDLPLPKFCVHALQG